MNCSIVFVGFLFSVSLSVSSCVGKKEVKDMHEWKNYSENFIRNHLNKKAIYPDITKKNAVVFFYNNDKDKHWAKVLINVDIDCSSCLLKFSFWNNFSLVLQKKYGFRIPIIAYVNAEGYNIEKRVTQYWSGSWVYDEEEEFIQKNELYDDRFQAILIDRDDNIRLIGNPMFNEKLAELYEKTILELFENKAEKME